MRLRTLPLASALAFASLLATSACKPVGEANPPAAPSPDMPPPEEASGVPTGRTVGDFMADAGHAMPVIIVLPDAGADAIAAAEQAVKKQVNHSDMPAVRLDLIADLLSSTMMGIAPGDASALLVKKLGAPEEKSGDEQKGMLWRWPALGVEAVVQGDRVQRIALHATARPADPKMKIFLGEVLVGAAALTQKAPDLQIKQVAEALGIGDGRGQMDAGVSELAWRRGKGTLFLTFDNDTLTLEAIVLEGFNQQIWDGMKPLDGARQIWEVEPSDVTVERTKTRIEFAQVPAEIVPNDLVRMRLIAGAQPHGKIFFDNVQAQFLGATESLRKLKTGRVAMLRADGCTYLVIEKSDGTWEARNPSSICKFEDEPKGLERLRKQFEK